MFDKIIDRSNQNSHKWALMKNKLKEVPEGVVPFTVADYDFDMMSEIKEALHEAIENRPMGYSFANEAFQQSIIDFLKRHYDYTIEKKFILDSPGVVNSLDECLKVFSEEKDEILVMTPIYPPFINVVKNNNRKCVTFELTYSNNTYSIDFSSLESLLQQSEIKVLLFCSPHNPTGRVWTQDELSQLANLCLKYDVLIVSDEIHAHLIIEPHRHIMIAGLSEEIERKTITLIAPTKTFNLAGLQVSQILVTGENKKKLTHFREKGTFRYINNLAAVASTAAYQYGDRYIDEFNELIKRNHLLLKTFIEEKLPLIKVIPLEGTYLQWLDFTDYGLTEKDLMKSLEEEAYLFFHPGTKFFVEEGVFMRWNLAYPTDFIEKALNRLYNVSRETLEVAQKDLI